MTIRDDISLLLSHGHTMDEIRVNDGDDSLGVDCACLRDQISDLVASWYPDDDQDEKTDEFWNRLPSAADWLRENEDPRDWSAYMNDATNLDDLLIRTREWSDFEHEHGQPPDNENIICDLPTFGGDEPSDTQGIYSWDETRLLVSARQDGQSGWEIIDRADATWLPENEEERP